MAKHNTENPDHMLAMSFSDFSFWCYSCDSYVIHSLLDHNAKDYPSGFYQQKFPLEAEELEKLTKKFEEMKMAPKFTLEQLTKNL